ncbi:MBL fold metallo-hydrolase [Lysinibacillus xylanilyticus]|uniref:MBL fold metallo-hydrolase n=1 Tax=Lysinibacillus xylanilyticus TaxID=582475 RepID=UPI002B2487AF|nr:MBL fold metallo-hydrolase [Lysinibacillus xylanilyticus]MEB2300006.1 MBL fold metallo-hydrolase [Lysinibacillus xylanilyticus]
MRIVSILENTKQDKNLTAKHGLSLYIETDQLNIIFDTGPDKTYIKNAQKMGIDLNKVDIVIISHGHSDHIGGLKYLNEINQEAKVYLSPHALDSHWLKLGMYYHNVGVTRDIKNNFENRLCFVENDIEIAKGIHIITLNPTNEYTKNLYKGANKELDDFDHEIMLVIENQNGIVLFSGCSHHGIVNMSKIALEKFPNKKIDVIIGGFHLIGIPIINTLGKTNKEISYLADTLNEMPINSIYSCHCTGAKGFNILKRILQNKLQPFPTGKEIILN